eukprot:4535537-Karenia_brevis.AAC.1
MYCNQQGSIDGNHFFNISRGVRQGDVLTALLFVDVLESSFCKWKRHLSSHGWKLHQEGPLLTNIRFADDILIVAKSKQEL